MTIDKSYKLLQKTLDEDSEYESGIDDPCDDVDKNMRHYMYEL